MSPICGHDNKVHMVQTVLQLLRHTVGGSGRHRSRTLGLDGANVDVAEVDGQVDEKYGGQVQYTKSWTVRCESEKGESLHPCPDGIGFPVPVLQSLKNR